MDPITRQQIVDPCEEEQPGGQNTTPRGAVVEWSHGAERASHDAVVSMTPSKNRTAGFPQYGFKADISGGAYLLVLLFKPALGIHSLSFSLHSPFASLQTETCSPALSRAGILPDAII